MRPYYEDQMFLRFPFRVVYGITRELILTHPLPENFLKAGFLSTNGGERASANAEQRVCLWKEIS